MQHRRRAFSLRGARPLAFPSDIRYVEIDGVVLAISPSTANWLVLALADVRFLELLRAGVPVGQALREAASTGHHERSLRVLAQVAAREFAGVDEVPQLRLEDPARSLHVYLTNACNLRCSHCYMYAGAALDDELTAAEWIDVLTSFGSLGGEKLTLSGGEITAKRGWADVVCSAHSLGLRTTLLTNGTLWHDSDIEFAAPRVAEIQVSIDGPNERSNAAVRGPGTFEPALRTALSFARRGVRTSVAMTPTTANIEDLTSSDFSHFVDMIRAEQLPNLYLKFGRKLIPGRSGFTLTPDQEARYQELIAAASTAVYDDAPVRNFALGHKPNEGTMNCGFGGLALAANGDAFACNRTPELDVEGNVRRDGLSTLLERMAGLHRATSVDSAEPCRECDVRYVCGGGCRIEEFAFRGRTRSGATENRLYPLRRSEHSATAPVAASADSAMYVQIRCDADTKTRLYRRMIDATRYSYDFST